MSLKIPRTYDTSNDLLPLSASQRSSISRVGKQRAGGTRKESYLITRSQSVSMLHRLHGQLIVAEVKY